MTNSIATQAKKLISEIDGHEIQIGERIQNFRGETFTLESFATAPAPSTGRVYVINADGFTHGYYPSVFNSKIVVTEDHASTEELFTAQLNAAEHHTLLYALRQFIADNDGKPQLPTTPSQYDVNRVKELLIKFEELLLPNTESKNTQREKTSNMELSDDNIRIAFDNGGGVTIISAIYAHSYNDGKQAAEDVKTLLSGGDIRQWDGNDSDLLDALTDDEIARYERVYTLDDIATLLHDGRVEIDGDEIRINGRLLSGYSVSQFFRVLADDAEVKAILNRDYNFPDTER